MRTHALSSLLAAFAIAGSITTTTGDMNANASEIIFQNGNHYDVLLVPGVPLEISFEVTVPAWTGRPTDTFLVVEAGGSYVGDLQTLKQTTQALSSGLRALNPDTRFGLGTFVDKPLPPFGAATDYEYRTDLAVTSSVSSWQSAIEAISFGSGSDGPESQLSSLLQVGLRADGEIGYRPDSLRVVILATDSDYHEAGDVNSVPANNGDTTLDGNPPGSGEDYPSVMQVSQALADARIVPVFLADLATTGFYDTLVTLLGRGASLVLSADASDQITAIDAALAPAESDVDLAFQSGDANLVDRVVADSVGPLAAGEMRSFQVTLLWDGGPVSDKMLGFDLTFDTGTVSITLPEPSTGVSGIAVLWTLAALRHARGRGRWGKG